MSDIVKVGNKSHVGAALLVQNEGTAATQHVQRLKQALGQALAVRLARLRRPQLLTSLTNHVEAARVAVQSHVLRRDLHVVVRVHAVRPGQETKQTRLRVQLLDHVKETHDDIVATGSLPTGEHTPNLQHIT